MQASVAPSQQYGAPMQEQQQQQYSSSFSSQQQQRQSGCRSFQALYSKHKTQKRKVWHDGRLVLQSYVAVLHAANPPPGGGDPALDTCALQPSQIQAIRQGTLTHLETEKFLVQIEGPWQGSSDIPAPSWGSNPVLAKKPSASMQKLMQRKFRKPALKRPPPPSTQQPAPWQQRKRPLQPGELQRQLYGQNMPQHAPPPLPGLHPPMPHATHPHRRPPPAQETSPYQQHLPQTRNNPLWNSHSHATNNSTIYHGEQGTSIQGQVPQAPPSAWQPAPSQAPPAPVFGDGDNNNQPGEPSPFGVPQPSATVDWRSNAAAAAPPPPQRGATASRRGNFVSNAFDPQSFYEEEEEEDDAEQGDDVPGYDQYTTQNSFQAPPPPVDQSGDYPGPSEETRGFLPSETRKELKASDSFAAPPKESLSNNQRSGGGTLTTDDLLDLFGGGTTQPETATTPKHFLSSEGNAAAEPGKENSPPIAQDEDFALPPPSDSSDDEEEED